MITVVEPIRHVMQLWGQQPIIDNIAYRLMRYVIRVECEGGILFHNTVTGQLVRLTANEAHLLGKLPLMHDCELDELIAYRFLVPLEYDEAKQVFALRDILRKFEGCNSTDLMSIRQYTILPTTGCNARCYYCFERGIKRETMSEQVANDTVEFICDTCDRSKDISILWFGGEPTIAANRITQICNGLSENRIGFNSRIITNGYLFNERLVALAKDTWNMNYVQIAVDGVYETYDRVKAYKDGTTGAYEVLMNNVERLLRANINVGLRMNVDLDNYLEFYDLASDVKDRFDWSNRLQLYAYPIIGEYSNIDGIIHHADESWFEECLPKLNDYSRSERLYSVHETLPSLKHAGCLADSNHSITITPAGALVKCPEQIDNSAIVGDIWQGINDETKIAEWHELSNNDMCVNCVFYPSCVKVQLCNSASECHYYDRNHVVLNLISRTYRNSLG